MFSSSSSLVAGGSHSLVFLSTAIFISTTLLFLSFPRHKSPPRSCLSSPDGKKKKGKKGKRVRFADNVKINIIRIDEVDKFKRRHMMKRHHSQPIRTRVFAFSSSPPETNDDNPNQTPMCRVENFI